MKGEYNLHFLAPKPPEKQIWELGIEERKKLAKDPKVKKQVLDEDQFAGTNIEVVWQRVRGVCSSLDGWQMTQQSFVTLCRAHGLTNEYLQKRLITIFDKDKSGCINGVLFTKHLYTAINDPACDLFVNAAFDIFDREFGNDDDVETAYLTSALKLQNPAVKAKKKSKKKKDDNGELEKQGYVTYPMQEAARKCLRDYPRANPFIVTRADFARWWEADADLIAAFLCNILEVAAHVYWTTELPKISGLFLKTLDAVQEEPFSDADWWLLNECNRLGYDPLAKESKKGKKKKKK